MKETRNIIIAIIILAAALLLGQLTGLRFNEFLLNVEINMRSLLKVVAIVAAIMVIKYLLKLLLSLIRKESTAVTLLKSLIDYAALILSVIWSLRILGADINGIIAGIGILALIIGTSAEGLIEDMLTGIFMLFEQECKVGDIVEVNASITTLTDEKSEKLDSTRIGGSMSENACFPLLPIFKFLGTDFRNINFYSKMKNDVDMFTKAVFRYDHAVASFQVGLGVKTEGDMTIAGTKGYVYVPAPWWKTDYFEVRYEDQNQNKKYFYPFVGEGLRYEIKDFVASVLSNGSHFSKVSKKENVKMAGVQELYIKGNNLYRL